ncbi:MAG: pyridoxamine 5'-phosphate oxidase [Nitrososphaerota archaeon]
MFSAEELAFLMRNELCRLATVDRRGWPHVVPVCYIFTKGAFYMVTDLGTKKLGNLQTDPRAALLVDTYKPNRAVLVRGRAQLLLSGPEFMEVTELFMRKFAWARADPWQENEAAIIKLVPEAKVSWGLGRA